MHGRLKQRLLSYSFLFFIILLIGKLFSVNKECNPESEKIQQHNHHGKRDAWNLNEHEIEINMVKEIERLKRSNKGKKILGNLLKEGEEEINYGPHKLAIIVPYRNRFEELKEFVPHMKKYLKEKKIRNHIYIINQVDTHRFNRASLINVGYKVATVDDCDYIAMHDVDLLPLNNDLNYDYPELGPFHVAGPDLHPKYHYKKFVGGILLLNIDHFRTLDGLSNKFWGWGREDDEFYMRIVDAGFKIYRHGAEITTGYNTFKHVHSKERKRDYKLLAGQKKSMFSRDLVTGLSTLQYEETKRSELVIDGHPCTVVDVELACDYDFTPWCDLKNPSKSVEN